MLRRERLTETELDGAVRDQGFGSFEKNKRSFQRSR